MPTLQTILASSNARLLTGTGGEDVRALQTDSRRVQPGDLFIAVKGTQSDGHDYLQAALDKGAMGLMAEVFPEDLQAGNAVLVQVSDTTIALGPMASAFYGEPGRQLQLIGVTGTNGKTTVATLLYKLFSQLGERCGLISTVQNRIGDEAMESTHTTPDPIALNALLARMMAAGCRYAFMECSSHAIHQQRIEGLHFAGGIFTNITHDHLDYHKTFDEYIRVKKCFFDKLPSAAFALTNIDDKRGHVMLQNTTARKKTYSLRNLADYKGKMMSNELTGLVMQVNGTEVHFRLIGEFNAYNLLAVFGAAVELGRAPADVLLALSMITGAEGRFDYLISPKNVIGIVDYAHTPDALENVLVTIQKLKKNNGRLITIVGCGGNRDSAKRPLMAESAARYSEAVILTSDNPRFEDPMTILADMQAGLGSAAKRKTVTEPDRAKAIAQAVGQALDGDIVLIAGKGHETYQEIQGVKYPFSDKEHLQKAFNPYS